MAVPFNIPEDQQEVEVIINQLQSLLTKLQAAVRRSRGPSAQASQATRGPVPASSRPRTRDESTPSTSMSSTSFPDLLNNLAWLAAASQDAPSSSSSVTANSMIRSPRRRISSESSNCKETKICITAIVNHGQDWNQGDRSELEQEESSDSFLSKFVPGPVSAPLWTAMICFVGWHLFQAR